MLREDNSKYMGKQKRKATKIEESYVVKDFLNRRLNVMHGPLLTKWIRTERSLEDLVEGIRAIKG